MTAEIVLQIFRFGFLLLLWLFIFAAFRVVRADLFGGRAGRVAQRLQEDRDDEAPAEILGGGLLHRLRLWAALSRQLLRPRVCRRPAAAAIGSLPHAL